MFRITLSIIYSVLSYPADTRNAVPNRKIIIRRWNLEWALRFSTGTQIIVFYPKFPHGELNSLTLNVFRALCFRFPAYGNIALNEYLVVLPVAFSVTFSVAVIGTWFW